MKNGQVEVLELDKYPSCAQRYLIKCLKCGNVRYTDKRGMLNKSECQTCSKNEFRLSDDGAYWVGITQGGEEFYFDGDDNTIDYIKRSTWRKTHYGYFQNYEGEKLHRVVMGITDTNIFVNHLGGLKHDNRKQNLTISDPVDNSREKRIGKRNTSGITGLMKRGKENIKWIGTAKIHDVNVYTTYKTREEALIDLLILQRHYGFRHNIDLYYLLDNISEERVKEVMNNIERQLNIKRNHSISSKNRFVLSECGTYYEVFDSSNNSFKISVESKEKVEQGLWYVAAEEIKNHSCVQGSIIVDGIRRYVRLHRYLFDIIDSKYKNISVNHINADALDNRLENLELTNANGVGKNKPALGYVMRNGKARAAITINGKRISKTFETEDEAVKWYNEQLEMSLKTRKIFKSKEEIDNYINGYN